MFQTSNLPPFHSGTSLLSPFSTTIILSGDTYVITYKNDEYVGNVIYKEHNMTGVNKPIRQKVYMIISSDMGDVIEYINKISPLTDGDITNINKIIRDDSLSRLTEFIKSN